jgi:hypothetical protein
LKIDDAVVVIKDAGRPRAAAAGARMSRPTLDRFAEVCKGLDPRATQPRIGNIPLVADSAVSENEIWLMSDQGEILQTIEITDE